MHIDSSLIWADVSWDAIARRHAYTVETINGQDAAASGLTGRPPPTVGRSTLSVCTTDPDASLTKNNKAHRSGSSYKHHTAVDAKHGVVLDVAITIGTVHDIRKVQDHLTDVTAATGSAFHTATRDASYAITRVCAELEKCGIKAIIPAEAERSAKKGTIPVRRFSLDVKNRVVRCPTGKLLRPHGQPDSDGFQHYGARVKGCRPCRLRSICFSPTMKRRAILLHPAP